LETFDKLSGHLINLGYPNSESLEGVISQVFNKAVSEPNFSSMYADLCLRLATACPLFPENKAQRSFRYMLLCKCQAQFETKPPEEYPSHLQDWEKEEIERKERKRAIGNIKFIGELYKHNLLSQTIISHCINQLLEYNNQTAELQLESLSQLLKTVGQRYENESKSQIRTLFERIADLSTDKQKPSRIRFMLQDLIDLRNNHWVTRRKEDDPKLIAEIHRDAELEEQKNDWESRNVRRIPEQSTPKRETNAKSSSFDDSDFYGAKRGSFSNDPKKGARAPGSTSPVAPAGTFATASVGAGGTPSSPGTSKDGWTEVSTNSRIRRDSKGRKDDKSMSNRADRSISEASDRAQNVFSALSRDSDKPPKTRSERRESSASPSPSVKPLKTQGSQTKISPRSNRSGLSNETKSPEKAAGPQYSVEEFEDKVEEIVAEYLQSHDQEEAVECLKELNSSKFNTELVNKFLSIAFEKSERDQEKLIRLFSDLLNTHFLSSQSFQSGFEQILEILEDIEIDTPLAPKIISHFLATGLNCESFDASFLNLLSPQVPSGKAFAILVETLLSAIKSSNQTKVAQKWSDSGLSALDFLSETKRDQKYLSDFLEDHEQGDRMAFLQQDPEVKHHDDTEPKEQTQRESSETLEAEDSNTAQQSDQNGSPSTGRDTQSESSSEAQNRSGGEDNE